MNKADVITKLEEEGAVKIFEGRSTEVKNGEGAVVHLIIPIFYFTQLDTNVLSERKSFELIEQGGTVDYHKGIPAILRPDPPAPTPRREFHVSDTQIKNGLEGANAGWEIIRIQKQRDGILDVVTVEVSDGTNVFPKTYKVWKRDDDTIDYKEVV